MAFVVVICGAGYCGLAISIRLVELLGDLVWVRIVDEGYNRDTNGKLTRKTNLGKDEVITLQDAVVYSSFSAETEKRVFKGLNERLWPGSRQIPIGELEKQLLNRLGDFRNIDFITNCSSMPLPTYFSNRGEYVDLIIVADEDCIDPEVRSVLPPQHSNGESYGLAIRYERPPEGYSQYLPHMLNFLLNMCQTRNFHNACDSRDSGYVKINVTRQEYLSSIDSSQIKQAVKDALSLYQIPSSHAKEVSGSKNTSKYRNSCASEIAEGKWKGKLAFMIGEAAFEGSTTLGKGFNSGLVLCSILASCIAKVFGSNQNVDKWKVEAFQDFIDAWNNLRAKEHTGRIGTIAAQTEESLLQWSLGKQVLKDKGKCALVRQLSEIFAEKLRVFGDDFQWTDSKRVKSANLFTEIIQTLHVDTLAAMILSGSWPSTHFKDGIVIRPRILPMETKQVLAKLRGCKTDEFRTAGEEQNFGDGIRSDLNTRCQLEDPVMDQMNERHGEASPRSTVSADVLTQMPETGVIDDDEIKVPERKWKVGDFTQIRLCTGNWEKDWKIVAITETHIFVEKKTANRISKETYSISQSAQDIRHQWVSDPSASPLRLSRTGRVPSYDRARSQDSHLKAHHERPPVTEYAEGKHNYEDETNEGFSALPNIEEGVGLKTIFAKTPEDSLARCTFEDANRESRKERKSMIRRKSKTGRRQAPIRSSSYEEHILEMEDVYIEEELQESGEHLHGSDDVMSYSPDTDEPMHGVAVLDPMHEEKSDVPQNERCGVFGESPTNENEKKKKRMSWPNMLSLWRRKKGTSKRSKSIGERKKMRPAPLTPEEDALKPDKTVFSDPIAHFETEDQIWDKVLKSMIDDNCCRYSRKRERYCFFADTFYEWMDRVYEKTHEQITTIGQRMLDNKMIRQPASSKSKLFTYGDKNTFYVFMKKTNDRVTPRKKRSKSVAERKKKRPALVRRYRSFGRNSKMPAPDLPRDVSEWDKATVFCWLRFEKCAYAIPYLKRATKKLSVDINGSTLLILDDRVLVEVGMESDLQRNSLLQKLGRLKNNKNFEATVHI